MLSKNVKKYEHWVKNNHTQNVAQRLSSLRSKNKKLRLSRNRFIAQAKNLAEINDGFKQALA